MGSVSFAVFLPLYVLIGILSGIRYFGGNPENVLGTWMYLTGFILIGHGFNLFGFIKVNILIIGVVIGTTFTLWVILKRLIEWIVIKNPLDTLRSIMLWLTIFILTIVMFHLVGYSLMYFGEHHMMANMEVMDIFSGYYEICDEIIDIIIVIPIIIIALIAFNRRTYQEAF